MSVATLVAIRQRRLRTRTAVVAGLTAGVVAAFAASLMVGNTFYGPVDVLRVVSGQAVDGASFAVGDLRLPRATLAVLAGASLGIAGVTFQTMLRNPLAAPDIIGISAGSATAAVVGIVALGLSDTAVSFLALAAGLGTAAAIYLLAHRNGFAGTRLILIGIGVAALLDSITAYVLSRASEWDLQSAMQWLTGSLNGATWASVAPLAVACALLIPALLLLGRDLSALRLGDDTAAALGVRVRPTRLLLILAAVGLLAFATAASGPIAFVAFMAGPIAARVVGSGGSLLVPAALTGALLVLVADLVGQNAFDNRYPVGVVTGALGAPFLLFLLVRVNRSGGSL
ncbi:MAG: iron chelate uptake ABC transporter family permease subunit [Actinomycetales bacterium]|nr:iron chelate uptake ABC transporter family permease subunit [Actinomycetales bacterium]